MRALHSLTTNLFGGVILMGGCAATAAHGNSSVDGGSRDAVIDLPDAQLSDIGMPPTALRQPRLLSPLSCTYTTHRRPTLRWQASARTSRVRVEIGRDRAFGTIEEQIIVNGNEVRPTEDLPRGVHFWRVLTIVSGEEPTSSQIWQFSVPPSSSPRDSAFGTYSDINGDGFGDLAIAADIGTVGVYFGGTGGLTVAAQRISVDPDFEIDVTRVGDVDGDGFTDYQVTRTIAFALGDSLGPRILYGSPRGLEDRGVRLPETARGTTLGRRVQEVGDWNVDGYADYIAALEHSNTWEGEEIYVVGGRETGVAPQIIDRIPRSIDEARVRLGPRFLSPGDVDGDGMADLIVNARVGRSEIPGAFVLRGGNSTVSTIATIDLQSMLYERLFTDEGNARRAPCDLDNDGLADVVAVTGRPNDYRVVIFRSSSLSPVWSPQVQSEAMTGEVAPWLSCARSSDDKHTSAIMYRGSETRLGVWDGTAIAWSDITSTYRSLFPRDPPWDTRYYDNIPTIGADTDGDGRGDIYVGFPQQQRGIVISGGDLSEGASVPRVYPFEFYGIPGSSTN